MVRSSPSFAALVVAAVWLSSPGSFVPTSSSRSTSRPGGRRSTTWPPGGRALLGVRESTAGLAPVAFVVAGLDALGAAAEVTTRPVRAASWSLGLSEPGQFVRSRSRDRATRAGRVAVAIAYVANLYVKGWPTPWRFCFRGRLPWFAMAVLVGLRHQGAWRHPVTAGLAFAAMTGINAGVVPLMQLLVVPAPIMVAQGAGTWRHIVATSGADRGRGRRAVRLLVGARARRDGYCCCRCWPIPSLRKPSQRRRRQPRYSAGSACGRCTEVHAGDPWQPGFSGYLTSPWLVLLTGLSSAGTAAPVVRRTRKRLWHSCSSCRPQWSWWASIPWTTRRRWVVPHGVRACPRGRSVPDHEQGGCGSSSARHSRSRPRAPC